MKALILVFLFQLSVKSFWQIFTESIFVSHKLPIVYSYRLVSLSDLCPSRFMALLRKMLSRTLLNTICHVTDGSLLNIFFIRYLLNGGIF